MFVEGDEKEFVLRIGGFEKLNGGLFGLAQFVGCAAAEIQDDTHGDGRSSDPCFRGSPDRCSQEDEILDEKLAGIPQQGNSM